MVILYERFRTKYQSHIQSSSRPLKMGPIRCPETSLNDYHSTLRNIAVERRSDQHHGGSLKSMMIVLYEPKHVAMIGFLIIWS
jgi:hypothetical protein